MGGDQVKDIEIMKQRTLARSRDQSANDDYRNMLYGRALFEESAPYTHNQRRALMDKHLFGGYPIDVDDDELIVGRYCDEHPLTDEERALAEKAREYIRASGKLAGTYTAFTGHRVIDYELLLNEGIESILERVEKYKSEIDYSKPGDACRYAFYDSVETSLNAFVVFCGRARETLTEKACAEKDPVRKQELLKMAANFDNAPLKPCQHFYEAVQIMWFMQLALCLAGDITLTGRFDNYMYPFYKKDKEAGIIDDEFAFGIICQLYMKHNEIYDAWPATIMVGGVNRDGDPVWNELSYMCIEAIPVTGLVNPSVNVSYNTSMPEGLMDRCLEIISNGYTRPAFFNDDVIQAGLQAAGMTESDSRYYINSTCVEITPVGLSNVQVATPYINLNKAYEYIFGGGKKLYGAECVVKPEIPIDLNSLDSFDTFKDLTKKVVRGIIRGNLEDTCRYLNQFSEYCASPLSSAFIGDCLEKGLDSGNGGARYSYVYPCFPGFLNLVDALAAVKHAVYEEKLMDLNQFGKVLKENFEGNERIRQYLINRCPKIGNGIDEVDQIGVEMYDLIRDELKKYTTSVGASFHPSYFAWIQHGRLGRLAAATPDGRCCGMALSESLGAVQGMDRHGPTGVMRSIEKIDQKYGIGGIATNMRFSKKMMAGKEGRDAVKSYIKTFMAHKCFEIQFNVVDQADLIEAKKNPEKYRTLMVRVAGYSDYFVNLSEEIQDEIISRNEHSAV